MNNRNYQKELEKVIDQNQKNTEKALPRLLLHSCCAPCSSYCMEYVRQYFDLTVFYYNPNIMEEAEYRKRVEEEKRLIAQYNELGIGLPQAQNQASGRDTDSEQHLPQTSNLIKIIEGDYDVKSFLEIAKGLEECPEGGERCFRCYELRLAATAELAAREGFDYFTTTLTISPLKNAEKLNEIGERLGAKYGVEWLPSDFKKKNGYQRSIELSKEFNLYRQNYCGCGYSKRDALAREEKNAQ